MPLFIGNVEDNFEINALILKLNYKFNNLISCYNCLNSVTIKSKSYEFNKFKQLL